MPVVPPGAVPGSDLRSGEPLKASKWETDPKMRPATRKSVRPLEDDELDRRNVEGQQCLERIRTNGRELRLIDTEKWMLAGSRQRSVA